MTFSSFIKKQATNVYKKFAGEPGKLLLYTGTIGWILSSLGQLFGIAINDKIPNNQKKFLIPQEAADAAVNIASFFILTKSVTDLSEWLVKSGKLATPKLRKFYDELHITEKIGTKGFNIIDTPQMNELNPNFKPELKEHFYNLFDGITFIGSTVGSIISGNIITPVLRNKFAADRQKQDIARDRYNKQNNNLLSPYTTTMPMQNRLGSGSMKI